MQIFAESDLRSHLDSLLNAVKQEILDEEKNQLLNANEEEYVEYLTARYRLDSIEVHWDSMTISDEEVMIRNDGLGSAPFRRQQITYHVSFSGPGQLLHMSPSTRLAWSVEVTLSGQTFSFSLINWDDNPTAIKRQADTIIANIGKQLKYANMDIDQYNRNLQKRAPEYFEHRKNELLKQSNLLANLGVPFTKHNNVPATFSIPTAKKKPIIEKPKLSDEPFKPEPVLDISVYQDILRICRDAGIEIERHPSIYRGKGEETLRDHFLMVLSPHFESATGETFNNTGKTDILIRHERANVFVAECKFWKGKKQHFRTVDQLLSYLTWRDSKSAILYFVTNKQLEPVLEEIRVSTPQHPHYRKGLADFKNGLFKYRFHLPDDETRAVELAIMCFHFPK
ncbi:MAG: hypothetical protein PVJ86_03945 [Phycisphaerales bacterium]|jgi:hypothetical protein